MSLVAGFEMQPLCVVYMLLVKLDFLTSTLFSVSFASPVHLILVLDGTGVVGVSWLDLALLLTNGGVLGSKGASVHFKSIRFQLTCTPFSV